jgi:AAA domain, putative AbiEii toxin, Type IV TA system
MEATSDEEQASWGGKSVLDLSSPDDMNLFRVTLQQNRRRQAWRSSLVNIESDRTIQNLQPLAFTWDMPDPIEEQVSWESTLGFMRDRFQDTVHSMFRMIEAQKQGIASRAVTLRRQGHGEMKLDFDDPMDPFKEVFASLVAPKVLVDPSARQQRLEYALDGEVFDFNTLSSGEREVVNIAFDFLLRRPRDCIIFFDEPELHLHPELSYRLIQTLQPIGERNQFVFSTHSPDIITSALDQSVVFISPPASEDGRSLNQAISVSESDETNRALRLLGQSIGIIALGKRIVLVEGEHSSLDKQTYGAIGSGRWPGLVLVPSGGKHVLESFSTIYDAVLSKSIWGVEFFMLCDRDSRPADPAAEAEAEGSGRLRVLSRYHLENYFLDENVWAAGFASLEPDGSSLRDPVAVRQAFRDLASDLLSYTTALTVSFETRQRAGDIDIMPKDCHGKTLAEVQDLLAARVAAETQRINTALDPTGIRDRAQTVFDELQASLDNDTNAWQTRIPGKPLLSRFSAGAGLKLSRAKNLYIGAASHADPSPFAEIVDLFEHFATVVP